MTLATHRLFEENAGDGFSGDDPAFAFYVQALIEF